MSLNCAENKAIPDKFGNGSLLRNTSNRNYFIVKRSSPTKCWANCNTTIQSSSSVPSFFGDGNTRANRLENKTDSGHFCSGEDLSNDTNKSRILSRVSNSDNCIPSIASRYGSSASSGCDSSSHLDGKQSTCSCHDSQKSSKPTSFTPSKQMNGYACCPSDQAGTSHQRSCCQQADKSEEPCYGGKNAKTKAGCCKSKSVEENQEESNFLLPSKCEDEMFLDMKYGSTTIETRCHFTRNRECSCCKQENCSGNCNTEVVGHSKNKIPTCCNSNVRKELLSTSVKPCCKKMTIDKKCSGCTPEHVSDKKKAALPSCCDSKTCKESLLQETMRKPCCTGEPCKVKAGEETWYGSSKSCNLTACNKSVINSCCQKDDKVSLEKMVPCCQNSNCEAVTEFEDESIQLSGCTPYCDDVNGHHISCTISHKSFTVSTNTVLIECPDDPAKDGSKHERSALLPKKCTTKLRVQNICCVMEATLVRECLEPLESVYSVAVNVIGRIAYVQHNPQITSPTDLVQCLNKIHLGASIMETGSRHDDKGKRIPSSLKFFFLYISIQAVLFSTALVGYILNENWYPWVAVAEILFGILLVIKRAFKSLKSCKLDISVLMFVAVAGTIPIEEYIEGAAVVFVFAVAEGLQELCMYKVQRTISSLMLKAPQVAVIAKTGDCVQIENIEIGAVIAVRPGELIPLDGVVVSGRSAVDESSISGEAEPVEKSVDSLVYSGTVSQNGYIEVRTTSDSSSSTVSKVSKMVQEAQASSATTEIIINRFAKYYTPLVIVVSALIVIIPAVLGASGVGTYLEDIKEWVRRALVMLVIACPCALVMSTPIAIVCGITGAARKGALIKGGVFVETLAQVETLAFDKTGTLTEGKFQVVDIECEFGLNERDTLRLAAAVESKSNHPLAAAIVNEFSGCVAEMIKSQGANVLPEVTDFTLHEGRGVSGLVEGQLVEIGNLEFASTTGYILSKRMEDKYHRWSEDSKTVVFVCVDSKLAMMIALADSIRPTTMLALDWLKHLGIRTAMITGDNSRTAVAVRDKLRLDHCVSEMKPKDKLHWIQNRQQAKNSEETKRNEMEPRRSCIKRRKQPRHSVVGMVGDGINDGPALAAANVGIAMGAGGTALAVEAADVALMSNNLTKIPELVTLGRFCRRVVIQNICSSVLLKLAVVIAAILGKASLWMAVCSDVLGLLFVILNGVRPLWWKSSKLKNKEDISSDLSFAKADRVHYSYESYV